MSNASPTNKHKQLDPNNDITPVMWLSWSILLELNHLVLHA